MQIGHKMTELEAFEILSVILEHPVCIPAENDCLILTYLKLNELINNFLA